MKRRFFLGALCAVLCLPPMVGLADEDDHDRARRALEAGEILPLRTILDIVERDYPGQILEVELERDDGIWLYEIKLIGSGGIVIKLELNARDGSLLKKKP